MQKPVAQQAPGVTYEKVDDAYFAARGLKRHAGRLVTLGARRRRGYLRALLGLEPRPRSRRLGRHAGRHHPHCHHVPRLDLLARRDEPGHAAHRRRLLVRAHRVRTVGRLHHGPRRERRIRDDGGRDRVLHRNLRRGHCRGANGNAAAVLDRRLRDIRRPQHSRRRAVVQVLARRHAPGAALPHRRSTSAPFRASTSTAGR